MCNSQTDKSGIIISLISDPDAFPKHLGINELAEFLHEALKPFNDIVEDIRNGLLDAFVERGSKKGFVLLATLDDKPVGALVMLSTGMRGYIPEYVLLFVAVSPDMRGKGIGSQLIKRALQTTGSSVKLHVEYDNPAKKLYERLGFVNKYADMRYSK